MSPEKADMNSIFITTAPSYMSFPPMADETPSVAGMWTVRVAGVRLSVPARAEGAFAVESALERVRSRFEWVSWLRGTAT